MSLFDPLGKSMSSPVALTACWRPLVLSHTSSISPLYDRLQRRRSESIYSHTKNHRRPPSSMENFFITALVRAGLCRHHATERWTRTSAYPLAYRTRSCRGLANRATSHSAHAFHSKTPSQGLAVSAIEPFEEEDPRHFVDFYITPERQEEQTSYCANAVPTEMELPVIEAPKYNSSGIATARVLSEEDAHLMEEFRSAVDAESENQKELYEAYIRLPHPRITYVSRKYRRRFLLKLAVVEKRTPQVMQQYISVLEDVRAAGLHIFLSEWNSAIHLVGRHLGRVSADEAEAAVLLYKEMERAGIEGNHVTFNILFDIAVKSGDFAFAEVILQEMKSRELELDRHGSVGKIYYHGLRHDGKGVRDAYVDLINCGQIVDTVVLNCVIASLLNAGERAAAEQVYYRMRNIYTKRKGLAFEHRSFRDKRNIARILSKASATLEKSSEAFKQMQDEQSRAPNLETFKILLRYHVEVTGELQGVTAILDDMVVLGVPAYGRFYTEIFKGFALHGGVPYTAWTKGRLESIWISFMNAASAGGDAVYLGKWSVIWILRAFCKCNGQEIAVAKWEAIKQQWSPTEQESEVIHGILSYQEYLKQKGWK